MATRKMSLTEWAEALELHRGKPSYKRFQGSSPGSAGDRLGVSRQRIHQFLKEGRLDMIVLHHDGDPDKTPCARLVTDESIERFQLGKMREQEPLRFSKT